MKNLINDFSPNKATSKNLKPGSGRDSFRFAPAGLNDDQVFIGRGRSVLEQFRASVEVAANVDESVPNPPPPPIGVNL